MEVYIVNAGHPSEKFLDFLQKLESEDIVGHFLQTESFDLAYTLSQLKRASTVIFLISSDLLEGFSRDQKLQDCLELCLGKGLDKLLCATLEGVEERSEWELHPLGVELGLDDRFIFDFSGSLDHSKFWKSFVTEIRSQAENASCRQYFDAYLSHSWLQSGHEKVVRIGELVRDRGKEVWIDEEQIRKSISRDVLQGIHSSKKVVLFLSPSFLRACRDRKTQAGKELRGALVKGSDRILLALLHPGAGDISKWPELMQHLLSHQEIYDLSSAECRDIYLESFLQDLLS